MQAAGIVLLVLLAALLLWFNDVNSTQATSAIAAKVRFKASIVSVTGRGRKLQKVSIFPQPPAM